MPSALVPSQTAISSFSREDELDEVHRALRSRIEDIAAHITLCEVQHCSPSKGISERLDRTIRQMVALWQHLLGEEASEALDQLAVQEATPLEKIANGDQIDSIEDLVRTGKVIRSIEQSLVLDESSGVHPHRVRIEALRRLAHMATDTTSPIAERIGGQLSETFADLLDKESQRLERDLIVPSPSPLSFVAKVDCVNDFLFQLEKFKDQVLSDPDSRHILKVSESQNEMLREATSRFVVASEAGLHRLAHLMCSRFIGEPCHISLEVCGETVTPQGIRKIKVREPIAEDELYTTTDLQFALRALEGYPARVSSSIFSYQPASIDRSVNVHGIHEIRTRLKASESLVDKITDHIYKINLAPGSSTNDNFSLYLKDVRGISFVVDTEDDVRNLYRALCLASFSDQELESAGILPSPDTRWLEVFRSKERLSEDDIHWRGIKFVMFWDGACTEVQIKTLDFALREQLTNTPESHGAYKRSRELSRQAYAEQEPLFHFCREYLKHVLIGTVGLPEPPPNVTLLKEP